MFGGVDRMLGLDRGELVERRGLQGGAILAQEIYLMTVTSPIAFAFAVAVPSAQLARELTDDGQGKPSFFTAPRRGVAGLTGRDIQREIYRRLGWPE
jgi:hypothetical protein